MTVPISYGELATSGDYERCIIVDGRRHGHLSDPRTGYPVHGLSSVSVVADRCLVAGTLSTIAMLRGVGGITWLNKLRSPPLWVEECGRGGMSTSRPTPST